MGDAGAVELTPEQIAAHDDQRDLGEAGEAGLVDAYRQVFPGARLVLDAGGESGAAVLALRAAAKGVVVLDWSFTMLADARGRTELRCAGHLRCMPLSRTVTVDGVQVRTPAADRAARRSEPVPLSG